MTATRKPGRPRDESIDTAILDAVVEEFIDKGFAGLSIEAIAARAGVAKTTIYRRWPTLEELCVGAICAITDAALTDPDDAPIDTADVRGELLAQLERMRRKWGNPRFAALMRRAAADAIAQPEVYHRMRERLAGRPIAAMDRTLQRAVDEGLIRADTDIDWARQTLTAPIMSATLTMRTRVTRAQMEFTLDTVLRGLAP
jgi:AcrR family transcriptional regulator